MRGDRRSSQSQPFGRKDAADAGARTVYHAVQARSGRGMTCARVRQVLAAYRRDEWSPAELEALGRHLASCAECRRVEATFREVGENVRQLPTITPPPSLRANVFAAIGKIAAEETPAPRSAVAMTRDDTQPRLTAVRRSTPDEPLRRPFVVGTPAAIAVA